MFMTVTSLPEVFSGYSVKWRHQSRGETLSAAMKSDLPGTMALLHSTIRAFSPLLTRFCLFHACRSTWRLCRSSSRRWPSGTRVSPAPARVRMGSQEGWEPSASWTTALQRRAWTDRRGGMNRFVQDTVWKQRWNGLLALQHTLRCTMSSTWWPQPGQRTQAMFLASQMLGSNLVTLENLHFCILKLTNHLFSINPMVLTCFVNINKLRCEHWLSCIENGTLELSVPQMYFFLSSSVQTRIHDWLLFHRQQAVNANPSTVID